MSSPSVTLQTSVRTEIAELGLLLAVGFVFIVLALVARAVIRIRNPDHGRVAVGPPPGHDPENPNSAFVSAGHWYTVEGWPALAPVPLIRPMTDGGSILAFLLFGLPILGLARRMDRRFKVCVYRGSSRPPLVRLVHVEFFDSADGAERRQAELIGNWDSRAFASSPPLSRREYRSLKRLAR